MKTPKPGIYSATIKSIDYPIVPRSGAYFALRVVFVLGGRGNGWHQKEFFMLAPREAWASSFAIGMGHANFTRLKDAINSEHNLSGKKLRLRLGIRKDKEGREWLTTQEYLPPINSRKAKATQRETWVAFSEN